MALAGAGRLYGSFSSVSRPRCTDETSETKYRGPKKGSLAIHGCKRRGYNLLPFPGVFVVFLVFHLKLLTAS